MSTKMIFFSLFRLNFVQQVLSHGWMDKPAMRGSMWRFPDKYPAVASPQNAHDNALRAGGPFYVGRKNELLDRRFGMCGDRYTDPAPREHESGGTYGRFPLLGSDAISACYPPGSDIEIDIEVTANHGGIFRYELCVPGFGQDETEDCFQNGHTLEMSDGTGPEYVLLSTGGGRFSMTYKPPNGVTCEIGSRCVLRWYWLTSNTPRFGSSILEEYWNCADIEISDSCGAAGPTSPTQTPAPSSTSAPISEPPAAPTQSISAQASTPPVMGTSAAPSTSSASSSSSTPSANPVSGPNCQCNEGYCPTGTCDNCLLIYGPGNNQRLCYVGFPQVQCVNTYQNLVWCGAT